MAQGLNFHTHQFVDPTEGLQKALGAGSMFAQSLKSMQDFESDQARLRMIQQEKDRQAKLDAEHAEDRSAAKKAKEEELGLARAISTKDTNYDATDAFNQLEAQGGEKFKQQLYKGDANADKMQMALGNTIVDQYMHNQAFEKSPLQKVEGYIQSKGGEGNVGLDTLITYEKTKADAVAAKAALSEKRNALLGKEADYLAAGKKEEYDAQMKLLDLQMKSNDSDYVKQSEASRKSDGTPGKDRFDSLYGNVGTNILKDPRVLKMDEESRQQLKTTLDQFRARGVNPAIASQEIWNGIRGVGKTTDSGEFTKFAFSQPNVEGVQAMTPEQRLAFDGGKEGYDYASFEQSRKLKDSLTKQAAKLIASNVGANDPQLANIRSQLAELDRSQNEIYRDENREIWNKFLRDNMHGYTDPNALTSKEQQAMAGQKIELPTSGSKDQAGPAVTAPEWSNSVKAFQLPKNYSSADRTTQNTMIVEAAKNHIRSEEGLGDGGKYKPYIDEQKDKNGKVIRRIPTLGHGINQQEFESAMKSELGGKYDPNNAKHRAIFDKYEDNRLSETVDTARNQAAALGLPAEAVPLLASMAHQHGPGWMSKWSGTVSDIKKGDYDGAIARIKESPWYKVQTPERAQKFVDMLGAVKEMKSRGSEWFDTHKADEKYDSSLQAKVSSPEQKSSTKEDIYARIQTSALNAARDVNEMKNYASSLPIIHPIDKLIAYGDIGELETKARQASMAKEYLDNAKAIESLKKQVSKIPSDLSLVPVKDRAAATAKIDAYNDMLMKLKQYEANNNTAGTSYMEENGIPLYSAQYKLR